jgi:cell wall-associated NlpC family hydrolase
MNDTVNVTREQIVATAREWLDTRWHHQGRLKGVGVDCAGLVVGVATELGLTEFDMTGYGHRPDTRELEQLCHDHMKKVRRDRARPGDVLLIEVDKMPQHMAIKTDIGMIHAFAPLRRVVEHRIDDDWAARITAAFRIPGVK